MSATHDLLPVLSSALSALSLRASCTVPPWTAPDATARLQLSMSGSASSPCAPQIACTTLASAFTSSSVRWTILPVEG